MKTPRVHDFDPNANIPQLGSPMEHMPAIQKPSQQPKLEQSERANARTSQRPNGKRIITRNSFEIYEDQMESRIASRENLTQTAEDASWEILPGETPPGKQIPKKSQGV